MFALYHRDVHGGPGQVVDVVALRVAVLAARAAGRRVRGARTAARAQRQPIEERRTARLLPHQRRPLHRGQRLDAEDGRAASCRRTGSAICSQDPRFATNEARVAARRRARRAGDRRRLPARTLDENLRIIDAQRADRRRGADRGRHRARSALAARQLLLDVPNGHGTVRMHNVVPRLSATPGEIALGRAARSARTTTPSTAAELGLSLRRASTRALQPVRRHLRCSAPWLTTMTRRLRTARRCFGAPAC